MASDKLNFTSEDGLLKCNGQRFKLKGLSWFGVESNIHVLHGLWCQKLEFLLDWCVSNNFNAIRVPFSVEFALNLDGYQLIDPNSKQPTVDFDKNPTLKGLTCGQVLDLFVKEAASRGLLIMFDMHVLYGGGSITEVWADDKNPESVLIQAWKNMLDRYNSWNLFAVDIKNEPHGKVTWGTGDPNTDFAAWCERCGNAILDMNPDLLIFCEGIDKYVDNNQQTQCVCWGGSLQWVANRPINLKNPKKLVYSPHQYGPGVSGNGCDCDDKLQSNFGFIRDMKNNAVVPGEWGGDQKDYDWERNFAHFMVKKDITDNFHWSLNPNSGDTKGLLLDDWTTSVTEKLAFCSTINPDPTTIKVVNGNPQLAVRKCDQGSVGDESPISYKNLFLDLHKKIHDPNNGYFSPCGLPYHSIETLMVEAPDHGHQTTSEAVSYYIWLEAMYGKITGDWSYLVTAWNVMETQMIPLLGEQPTNDGYQASKPATYAAEHNDTSLYPSDMEQNVPVGNDPIANDIVSKHGSRVYGMHWLKDLDDFYGFGSGKPAYINTFQRGAHESVWKCIAQPSIEQFSYGGNNGFLDLFVGGTTYSKQWRFTNAPDADGRAISAIYWAKKWADAQGGSSDVNNIVVKASNMGDWLRYAMFDKYFKPIGCQSKYANGGGYDACHYLMSWFYAWGGPLTPQNWAWKIGCSHNHFGYQNPFTAWVLGTNNQFIPNMVQNASTDWNKSLKKQIQLYYWLQSAEGAIAGGCTNCYNGDYSQYPSGTVTFFNMVYDSAPVFVEPPSNNWFGFQTWSMERMIQYYYESKDQQVKLLLDKWISWVKNNIKTTPDVSIPSGISWTGQPDTSFNGDGIPNNNTNLHVNIDNYGNDLGIMSSLARCLIYYQLATGDNDALDKAHILIGYILKNNDNVGYSVQEDRADYVNKGGTSYSTGMNTPVYIPSGYNGKMPNGDPIVTNSTFISLRSKLKQDPQWSVIDEAINKNSIPKFRFHRYWSACEIALTLGLLSGDGSTTNTTPQIPPNTTPQQNAPQTPTTTSGSNNIVVTTNITSSWNNGNGTTYQMSVDIKNTGTNKINDVVISKPTSIGQFWNMKDNGNTLSLPDWAVSNGIMPNSIFNFGGQFTSNQVTFNIIKINK